MANDLREMKRNILRVSKNGSGFRIKTANEKLRRLRILGLK